MVEKYLGNYTREVFSMGASSALMEKDAFGLSDAWDGIKWLAGGGKTVVEDAFKGAKNTLGLSKGLALAGLAAGTLGGMGYNLVKERLQQEDPEEKMQRKIEAIYKRRSRELSDAKWMAKVRSMRDELQRGYKKMSTEEYEAKYNQLMAALDEKEA